MTQAGAYHMSWVRGENRFGMAENEAVFLGSALILA